MYSHRVDWKLLPILGAMYAVSLIDRTNMSNALIAGMGLELNFMVGDRYSIALLLFFVPYFLFELPSNILLRKIGAARWLGSITMAWGLVMMGMGFAQNWWSIAILRTVLGLFEAGFFPGCVYLISCWYVRYEVQKRLAAFFLVSVLAGGFSPLLATALIQMKGLAGYLGWRWIFIIEGIATVIIGILAFFFVIEFPDKVLTSNHPFLTATEVNIVKFRIDRDRKDSEDDPLTWGKVGKHLSDWKLWAFAFLYMCSTMPTYALAYFLPVILQEGLGYSMVMSQLLSAPPYVFAAVAAFALAVWADKAKTRAPFIAGQAIITIVGCALTGWATNNGARYFGAFLGAAGSIGNVPACLAYQSNNIRTNSKRSVGSALQVGFGSIGGILASTVYRNADRPRYLPGLWTTVGCQLLILVLLTICTAYFRVQNKKQEKEGKKLENCEGFRYTI
ncbi:major facilitator superfamily domain-containing protein [Kalaharituber pfeilii]|nr:major facilitator superfamily domain-containing protein [Kalaharituber pfeilii]